MDQLYRSGVAGKRSWISIMAVVLMISLVFTGMLSGSATVEAAGPSCKDLCKAALKATGNSSKIKYKSEDSHDFAGFSISEYKKVSSIMYIFDAKEVYGLCVVRAANSSAAAALQKSMKSYKTNNCNSDYLGDYSSEEQKVLKNAVYGRKGKYVWYIAMSSSKSVNEKGQKKIKKAIKA